MKSKPSTSIKILYLDPYFFVAEKSPGIATQPLKNSTLHSFAELLAEDFPELKNVGGSDWGAVHRLDVETSGLVIFARNQKTYDYFRKAFSSNKIEKEYRALVQGHIAKAGKITWPIGPDPKSAKRVKVFKDKKDAIRNKAQEALTFYKPLQYDKKTNTTLLNIKIKTGRRHQIRAHLSALAHPIVGDKIYGKGKSSCLNLHAHRLRFAHPISEKMIEVLSSSELSTN